MEAFNFGPIFREWIQLLLHQRTACINLSGHNTKNFMLERRLHLWLPFSDRCQDAFASTKISKLTINGSEHSLQLYAADLMRDAENIRQLFKILEYFRMLASLAVNLSKTAVIHVGSNSSKCTKKTQFFLDNTIINFSKIAKVRNGQSRTSCLLCKRNTKEFKNSFVYCR